MLIESPTSVFQNTSYATYEATLEFTHRLVGGSPSDPKLVEGWLAKNLGVSDDEQLRRWTMKHLAETRGLDPAEATVDEIEAALDANAVEKKANVFKRTPTGEPYIEPRHVKAMLKEATSIAYPRGTAKFGQYRNTKGAEVGGKSARDFLAERVFVNDQPIIVGDDVDGIELFVGHPFDKYGQRYSTLNYFEYVERPTISVTLNVLDDCVTSEQWSRIWTVAERNGLGAYRSQGFGQFVVTAWNPS